MIAHPMTAGRELDALVAEKVMGWIAINPTAKWSRYHYGDPGDEWTQIEEEWCRGIGLTSPEKQVPIPFPRYSTSIAAAWGVVEKFTNQDDDVVIGSSGDLEARWSCSVVKDDVEYNVFASTAPLAICLAALKAVGYTE